MSLFNPQSAKTRKEIERALSDIQINLENNYKDLAIKAYKDAETLINNCHTDNRITPKQYAKYASRLAEYAKRMEGYSHRLNIKY